MLRKLSRLSQNVYSFKNIVQKYPTRNESFLSTSRQSSTFKTVLKASLVGISIGFPVGVVITSGYSWYINRDGSKTYHLEGKEQTVEVLKEKPQVPISRQVCPI